MSHDHTTNSPPAPGHLRWGVREPEGNVVIIEFECYDAYEAIEFAEVCAAGLSEGELTIEVHADKEPENG